MDNQLDEQRQREEAIEYYTFIYIFAFLVLLFLLFYPTAVGIPELRVHRYLTMIEHFFSNYGTSFLLGVIVALLIRQRRMPLNDDRLVQNGQQNGGYLYDERFVLVLQQNLEDQNDDTFVLMRQQNGRDLNDDISDEDVEGTNHI